MLFGPADFITKFKEVFLTPKRCRTADFSGFWLPKRLNWRKLTNSSTCHEFISHQFVRFDKLTFSEVFTDNVNPWTLFDQFGVSVRLWCLVTFEKLDACCDAWLYMQDLLRQILNSQTSPRLQYGNALSRYQRMQHELRTWKGRTVATIKITEN